MMGWGITREADIDSEERTRTIDIFPVVEESGKVSLITRVAKSAFILNREQRNALLSPCMASGTTTPPLTILA